VGGKLADPSALSTDPGKLFSGKHIAMASMAKHVDNTGADGLVLFNRFYQPDFDGTATYRDAALPPQSSWPSAPCRRTPSGQLLQPEGAAAVVPLGYSALRRSLCLFFRGHGKDDEYRER
jgi:hypothetical protein